MSKKSLLKLWMVLLLGLSIPAYYKIRFYMVGELSFSDIFHWTGLLDIAFATSLVGIVVLLHNYVESKLRKSLSQAKAVHRIALQFIITGFLSVGISIVYSQFFWTVILPYGTSSEYIFDYSIFTFFIPILIHGVSESFYYYGAWEDERLQKQFLQQENIKSQFEVLKNQINPHFLFNSFNTLAVLIQEEKDKALSFLRKLSDTYRYILDNRNNELVSFNRELQAMQDYVHLMQLRLGEKFRVSYEFHSTTTKSFLPPLTLQMLMENALKHNTGTERNPIAISLFESKHKDYLIFSNNLNKRRDINSSGLGLTNIQSRYELLSEKKVKVLETPSTFEVHLPLLALNNYEGSNH